ncbi:MAG: dihydrodipicolinate synthase family protein [Alphaproteobacteria bacterium]|nr:dihydrodipicolinate synthase family protein [Alphaproteobacteria bacterium]
MDLMGIIPPMTTPFRANGDIDLGLVKPQVDWLVTGGAHGLAAGGSTGEGHTLEAGEFRDLMAATCEAAASRVPVVAGVIVDSTRAAIQRGRLVRDMKIAALQVTPVHYLFRPDDEAMVEHFRAVAGETGQPIIIYNVVPWTYLSPALLVRIMREVPAVIGVKQSAGDLKLFADLMIQADPRSRIFSAVDALLYSSFALGAHGAIAAILTAAPRALRVLWDAVQQGDHARGRALHEKLLPLWNAAVGDNLPACTRYAQALQGIDAGVPRAPMPPASAEQRARIEPALKVLLAAL